MACAYLGIVLHAHLPDLRENSPGAFEERWLFEAVIESYLPLIRMLERLRDDGVAGRLTVSLSPTLCAMLDDDALLERCARHMSALIDLTAREERRHAWDVRFRRLATRWRRRLTELSEDFEHRRRRLLPSFDRLARDGVLELITTAATHGYLPLLGMEPPAAQAQIRIGMAEHRRRFQTAPVGFWPPELGLAPGLENDVVAAGAAWICADAHAALWADRRPHYGTFAPIACPNGLAVFPRDAELSRCVWSAHDGYPGDPWYREYHRDIGFELSPRELGELAAPPGARGPTGIKYHRVTGGSGDKEPYDPDRAADTARRHAADFLDRTAGRAWRAAAAMDRPPLLVAAFDAELFGHWWHEGPLWLEAVIRGAAAGGILELITPTDYLQRHPRLQCATPAESSWGAGGGHETWWNEITAALWARMHRAARRLAARTRRPRLAPERTAEAARHLLIAQASDWLFMIRNNRAAAYATRRWSAAMDACERWLEANGDGPAGGDVRGSPPAAPLFPELELSVFGD